MLLPTELAPLHIFEERYKRMINRCLEDSTEFGIVWLGDDGLAEVGCTARITELIDRMDDGRMNILVRGERPFRLLRRVDDLAYPAGDIEVLEDETDASESHAQAAQDHLRRGRREGHRPAPGGRGPRRAWTRTGWRRRSSSSRP